MNSALMIRIATEPRRLEILQMIWDRERNVGDIAARLPVSVGAVSQHLSKLHDSGLVTVRSEGRWRFYQAARHEMGIVGDVLEAFWADRLRALKHMAEGTEAVVAEPASPGAERANPHRAAQRGPRRAPNPPQQPRDRRQTWKTMQT